MKRGVFLLCLWLFYGGGGGIAWAQEVPEKINLVFDDRIITLNFRSNPTLLKKLPVHYVRIGNKKVPVDLEHNLPSKLLASQLYTEFKTVVSEKNLKMYFDDTSLLGTPDTRPIRISVSDSGKIKIDGRPRVGHFKVDIPKLVQLMNTALETGMEYVRVPSEKVFNPVIADKALQERGIKEIIAIGRSNFKGSSKARIQNIMAGARKFDGLIIKKGQNFSFNQILKSVEESDGFVKELVIKGNTTEKELGGGVCQVSTTVYRAAFEAGLDILDRRAHSYAVSYYKPYGYDATIYLGGQDFRFKNDTPGDILIQSFVEGNDLFFVFYGTDDQRKVSYEGPFISEYKPAPEPQILETTELPPGEVVEVNPAHDGFRAEWIRRVQKIGEKMKEESFVSYYRPWPARILKGVEAKDSSDSDVLEEKSESENSITDRKKEKEIQ